LISVVDNAPERWSGGRLSWAWEEEEWRSNISGFSTSTSVVDTGVTYDVVGWLQWGDNFSGLDACARTSCWAAKNEVDVSGGDWRRR